jgi:hypothetical protein
MESCPLPGSAPAAVAAPGAEQTAVKDAIVRLRDRVWQASICCHLLDIPGARYEARLPDETHELIA